MKIKNGYIIELANVLHDLKLKNKESRMRTRFKKDLGKYYNEVVEKERKELLEINSIKNDKGEIIEIKEEYYSAYEELLNEYLVIDKLDSNKEMLTTVAHIMLNTEYEFSENLADLYDIWCEEFEEVLEYYKDKR